MPAVLSPDAPEPPRKGVMSTPLTRVWVREEDKAIHVARALANVRGASYDRLNSIAQSAYVDAATLALEQIEAAEIDIRR